MVTYLLGLSLPLCFAIPFFLCSAAPPACSSRSGVRRAPLQPSFRSAAVRSPHPTPSPGVPFSVFSSSLAALQVLTDHKSSSPPFTPERDTQTPVPPRGRRTVRAQPLPTLARPTRGRTTGRAPDAAHPALPRGPRGRGCKAGRRPNLTYDREPGAGAEELLIGAQRPRPARKPAGAAAAALVRCAPLRSRAARRRGPDAGVRRGPEPLPSIPTRRRAPRPLTQHGEPAAGAEGQDRGGRAQPRGSPQKPGARRASRSPSTSSRVRLPKYCVSPSRPPGPAQTPARGVSPLTQHRQPGARAEILLVCAHSTEARDKNSAAAPDSARPPATLDAPSLLPRPEPGVPGPGAARL